MAEEQEGPQQSEQPQQEQSQAQAAPKEKAPSKWPERWARFKAFVKESRRVLTVTKKPTADEFRTIVKISGIGILLIGFIGFLIFFAAHGIKSIG